MWLAKRALHYGWRALLSLAILGLLRVRVRLVRRALLRIARVALSVLLHVRLPAAILAAIATWPLLYF